MTGLQDLLLAVSALLGVARLLRPGELVDRAIGVELVLVTLVAWVVLRVDATVDALWATLVVVLGALMFVAGSVVAAFLNDRREEVEP
jgi:multisubunit Na+/H+ antiporter MnhF subunit